MATSTSPANPTTLQSTNQQNETQPVFAVMKDGSIFEMEAEDADRGADDASRFTTLEDASVFIDEFHPPNSPIWPDLARLRKALAALASAPTAELVAKIASRFADQTPGKTEAPEKD